MYVRKINNGTSGRSEVFLETEAERRHFDEIRRRIWSREAEASRLVSGLLAERLDVYANSLADTNQAIRNYQKKYNQLSWFQRFFSGALDPEVEKSHVDIYVSWSWANEQLYPAEYRTDSNTFGSLLPAYLPMWEYRSLEQYKKDGNLIPFIEINHTENPEDLHYYNLPRFSGDLSQQQELNLQPGINTLYCVKVKPAIRLINM